MRIAIVGTGISGLVCARALHPEHEIVLFEANDYVGGHTHTVDVAIDEERHAIDTGFIVFNEGNYPNFRRLMDELGVASRESTMSFSVRCDRTGLEYAGSNLNTLFAQRRNLFRPAFHLLLRDILRFNRETPELLDRVDATTTVDEFLTEHGYSRGFSDHYLLPMGGAIWSCPTETFGRFPIRFVIEFYRNHGLLKVRGRPVWRTIVGGSRSYVERLIEPFADRIRLRNAVRSVSRTDDRVVVTSVDTDDRQSTETFDEVVFACHSDQALELLADADDLERELLGAFPYGMNDAVLHTDTRVLPRRRRAWSSWNYRIPAEVASRPTVTYDMNQLQGIDSKHTFCVSLNEGELIDPSRVLGRFRYAHPVFTTERDAAQARHREVVRRRNTSFCGAYWGNGFHEDGVNSALVVADAFGREPWTRPTNDAPSPALAAAGGDGGP